MVGQTNNGGDSDVDLGLPSTSCSGQKAQGQKAQGLVYVGKYLFPPFGEVHEIQNPSGTLKALKIPQTNGSASAAAAAPYTVFLPREPKEDEALLVVKSSLSGRSFFCHLVRVTKARQQVSKCISQLLRSR